jgi:hypothetical protein
MTEAGAPYVEMIKNGTYQVKVPLIGHALPHVLPCEFLTQEAGEQWLESPEGRARIKQVRDEYAPPK